MAPAFTSRNRPRALVLGIGLGLGLTAGIGIAACRGYSAKYYLPALAALLFAFALVVARRHAERICLWAFLLAAPLPMHVFLVQLEPLHGGGALGIYLQPPDFCLALLYAFWIAGMLREQPVRARSWRAVLVFLPFLFWGAMSMLYASNRFWAECEWLRWVKVFLVLLYAARRLKSSDIESCAAVMAVSASLQATVGILQFSLKSNLGLEKLGLFGSGARYDATQEILGGMALFRGSGLTSHPNFLASYLLLILPLLLLRSITAKGKTAVLWYASLAICGGGIFSTMSRAAWASLIAAGALAFIAAIAYKLIHLRRAFQLTLALFTALLILVLSFFSTIRGRFEADFSDSWKLRKQLAATAADIAADHPVIGVGLNNYTLVYPQYNPNYAGELMDTDEMITVVHNVFLLVLAETGVIGLAAFLTFYLAPFFFGLPRLGDRSARARATVLGLLAGILGAMLFDLTEFALWTELCMYTVAFIVAMVASLNPRRSVGGFLTLEPPLIAAHAGAPEGADV